MIKKYWQKNYKYLGLAMLLAGFLFALNVNTVLAEESNTSEVDEINIEIEDINKQIDDKQSTLDELNQKIKLYEENIKKKQDESLSLQSQVDVIGESIAKKEATIQTSENEIEILELEIEAINLKIEQTQEEIDKEKNQLDDFLKEIYIYSNKTYLEIALNYNSFSDYFREVKYLEGTQSDMQGVLTDILALKVILDDKEVKLDDNKTNLVEKRDDLVLEKSGLEGEKQYTDSLLSEVAEDEELFQQLVETVKKEQQSANSTIITLEKQLRAKLSERKKNEDPNSVNTNESEEEPIILDGPFNPSWPTAHRLITAYFHDPEYPFRRWFEHNAVDIAIPQGTGLGAVAPGYVAIARNAGLGYSYVMIVHTDGYSSVYGHVSSIYVRPDQYVNRGEIIGLSGGMPGSSGAGSFSTGPHLHLEIRLNGIPVDPLNYLP